MSPGSRRVGVGVHLDLGLGAQRAGDDRLLRVVLGVLGGDLAAALQLGHQRVVVGELLELAVAQPVGAAVAHVRHGHPVALHHRRGEGRAHPRAWTRRACASS